MQTETAKALIEALANNLVIAIDNRNKLTALEALLQEREPELFERYSKILEKVRQNPPTSVSIEGFARLQEKLAQG
jgi:hypothetical protein